MNNIWEVPKDHYNWESPLTKIYGDMHNKIIRQDEENCTFVIEQALGYKVDKDELIKALQYDREQYDKGYRDGVKEKFIEELVKIKEKIDIECDSVDSALDVIINRIIELKGEDK